MRATRGPSGRRRPRAWRGLGGAVVAAALLPYGWTWNDPGAHAVSSLVVLVGTLVVLVGRDRATAPEREYAAALERADALHVHLTRARVVCVSRSSEAHQLTFTWQGARTDLLDADGRVLHTVLRNCLETGFTLTVPVGDADVAHLLAADRVGGHLDVYACVDLVAHPDGGVARHGVVRDRYGVQLTTWSGVLTPAGRPTSVDAYPA